MNIIGIEKLIKIIASFSILFNLKKASHKHLKSKIYWFTYIFNQPLNIVIILLNLKYKKVNVGF